jgi:hypothetical protein
MASTGGGRIIYVDVDANGLDDGSSWSDAFHYVQDALAVASSSDEIRIADGVYKPDRGGGNIVGNRHSTFRLVNGVVMKGGYAGFGAADSNARAIGAYDTILSGDLAGNDGPNFANKGENSYHVVTGSHTNATAVLDLVTITGGNAEASPDHYGGGLYIAGGSPTLINCTFRGNWAKLGGGLAVFGSNSTLRHCKVVDNSALLKGGGMCCTASNLTITNCTIRGNSAVRVGSSRGGGLWCRSCISVITNTVISGNSADTDGAGIYNDYESDLILTNCTITGNSVGWATGGGMANHFDSHPILTNCIVYGNRNAAGTDQSAQFYGNWPVVNYCCVQGWTGSLGGVGNIGDNPLFVDAQDGDYHLRVDSPCIHAGAPHGTYEGQVDGDGQPRVMGGRVDMGADEYGAEWPPVIAVTSTEMEFVIPPGDTNVGRKTVSIWNVGIDELKWEVIKHGDWLGVYPTSGRCSEEIDDVAISIDSENMVPGVDYKGVVLVHDFNAINSPEAINIRAYLGITLHVPGEYPTIQAAVDAARDGDVVVVADGTYSGQCNRDINVWDKAVTIRSATGPESCTIDCGGSRSEPHRGFSFEGSAYCKATLEGFRIVNGYEVSGGGIYSRGTNPTIANCIISGNRSEMAGGGIMCEESAINVTNCIISDNIAEMEGGGGITFCADSSANISGCIVSNNLGEWSGGGILGCHSSGRITRCTISSNRTAGYGGGVSGVMHQPGGIFVANCLISGNTAGMSGGGITGCDGATTSCTITGNSAVEGAGLSYCEGPISNCIVWDNNGPAISGGEFDVTYTDVEGGYGGTGNVNADPLFFEPCDGDYHLLPGSPGIDAGDPGYAVEREQSDLDGNPRVIGGRMDMGCYEFDCIQAEMKLTPQALNLGSRGKSVKAHLVLGEGYTVEDVDANRPVKIIEPYKADSESIDVSTNEEGLVEVEAAFDRAEFCAMVPDDESVEVRVSSVLTNGRYICGRDRVRITTNRLRCVAGLAFYWLQAGCGKPQWCDGADLDQDGAVDFADFALFDGCCIEVTSP